MRLLEIHTVPLWEEADGTRTLGMRERQNHPPVVGWCNTALLSINGELRWFLLTLDALADA
jgi:hypothetical protein